MPGSAEKKKKKKLEGSWKSKKEGLVRHHAKDKRERAEALLYGGVSLSSVVSSNPLDGLVGGLDKGDLRRKQGDIRSGELEGWS